jgi:GntR family transcriptional regulator
MANKRSINYGAADPPWQQLAAILRAQLASGKIPPGGRLPSVRTLSEEYGLAGITVRKAITQLRKEGLIVTRPGWGIFAVEHPPG